MNPNQKIQPDFEDGEEDIVPGTIGERIFDGLAYLWFQRQIIFGMLLTIGLGYGIYRVYIIPPEKFDDEPSLISKENLPTGFPKTDINFDPNLSSEKETASTKIRTMSDIALPKKKAAKPYDPILDDGTVGELIEESLTLRENWVKKSPPVQYLMFQRRAKIARKLMQKPISEPQQVFAIGEYIEALILLDNIVSEKQYKTPQVRMAIEEIVSLYSAHKHPVISAKANLAAVLVPIHDFLFTNSDEQLLQFLEVLPGRLNKITQDLPSTQRLAGMAMLVRKNRSWDGSALPYCMDLATRLEAFESEQIRMVGLTLREKLNFAHLEPDKLVSRIALQDIKSRRDVSAYFEALDANPNVRLRYFQVAVSTIKAFKILDKKDDYKGLLDWLRQIATKVESEASRKEIATVIMRLEELPFGPEAAKPTKEEDE